MRNSREIEHPNGRHRLKLFDDKQGAWRYQQYDLFRKRWRAVLEPAGPFESYARTLVEAQNAMPWVTSAVSDQSDWRHGWHLELSRGLAFRFTQYDESKH